MALDTDISAVDFSKITSLVEKYGGVKYLGIDMRNCVYMQSKMLAELIALKKLSMAKKFDIALLNINENVSQVLEMASLLSFFIIEDDFSAFDIDDLCEHFLDPVEAQNICDYLVANYDDSVREKLEELIKADDPIKTEYAILTMGRAQDFAGIDIFRRELDNPAGSVRLAAILALGWLGDTESKERIYKFLSDKDAEIAEAAAASVALLSDNEDSEKLSKYLESSDDHIRRSAVLALSLINDEKGFFYIKDRFGKETGEPMRVALTRAVSSFNMESARDILIKLLDDPSIAVREAAASGIVRVGPKNYAEVIAAKVTDKDSWVGFFAAKALAGVGKEISDKLRAAYPIVEQNVKLAIIEVLGKSKADVSGFLMERIGDENEDIRKEALNALDVSGSPAAIEVALKLYDKDESWLVRYKAVEMIASGKPAGYCDLLKKRIASEENRYVREKLMGAVEG